MLQWILHHSHPSLPCVITKSISHIVEQDTITYTAMNAFKQAIPEGKAK